ncbi:MAG: stalk domain-containing protein, partial [Caldisericia bacterium]|nr:stalk domain-containing protein [Caldisericia bacterium]
EFDSVVGLQVHVIPEGPLHPNKTTGVNVKVTEIGTQAPVEGANVTAKGPGVNASKKTDKDGMAVFEITPNDKGMVVFTATKEGRIIGVAELPVIPDTSAPWLQLDPVNPLTNNPNQKVTGRTNPGNKVTLNGTPAQVNEDGSFTGTVTLKEGLNTIVGEAVNPAGLKVRKLITVTLDTTPPNIFLDDPGRIIYSKDIDPYQFTGRVDILSSVTINGVKAEVVHDIWKAKVAIKPGKNTLTMVAVDQAGNSATVTAEVEVWERNIIKLTIGNVEWTKNGEALKDLDAPAQIMSGRTMVPLRAIAEAFGAEVGYDPVSKGITITLGDSLSIAMTVGEIVANVNGEEVILDVAPVIVDGGRTLVPIRFIGEAFGAEVLWDAATRTVTIIRDTLP